MESSLKRKAEYVWVAILLLMVNIFVTACLIQLCDNLKSKFSELHEENVKISQEHTYLREKVHQLEESFNKITQPIEDTEQYSTENYSAFEDHVYQSFLYMDEKLELTYTAIEKIQNTLDHKKGSKNDGHFN